MQYILTEEELNNANNTAIIEYQKRCYAALKNNVDFITAGLKRIVEKHGFDKDIENSIRDLLYKQVHVLEPIVGDIEARQAEYSSEKHLIPGG